MAASSVAGLAEASRALFHIVDAAAWAAAVPSGRYVRLTSMPTASSTFLSGAGGAGQQYPHLHGPVPTDAAVVVHPLPRGLDGRCTFGR
ncbi:MAG: hypothetical protein ABJA87_11005 [bacterium]